MKALAVAALAAAVTLGGCSTFESARTRLVRTPTNCVDQTVQIYFEPESAELTQEGRQVIETAAANLRNCRVLAVEVLGLADAPGAPDANLALSQRRAQSVSHTLAASRLPAAEFRIAAAGEAGAVTPSGDAAPLRRRVDVTLRARR